MLTIKRIVANLFDRDVKIGDHIKRNETKPEMAKSRGDKAFNGKLVILVDSRSASASEVLARVVQLEKRGRIIGDQTRWSGHDFTDVLGSLDCVSAFSMASVSLSQT